MTSLKKYGCGLSIDRLFTMHRPRSFSMLTIEEQLLTEDIVRQKLQCTDYVIPCMEDWVEAIIKAMHSSGTLLKEGEKWKITPENAPKK